MSNPTYKSSSKPRHSMFCRAALLSLAIPFCFTGCEAMVYETQLATLTQMHDNGLMTDDAYDAQHQKILDSMKKSKSDFTQSMGKMTEGNDKFMAQVGALQNPSGDGGDDNDPLSALQNMMGQGGGGGGSNGKGGGKAKGGKTAAGKGAKGAAGKSAMKGGKLPTNAFAKKGAFPMKKPF